MFNNLLSFLSGHSMDVVFRVTLHTALVTNKPETPTPDGEGLATYSIERVLGDNVLQYSEGESWFFYKQFPSDGWKKFILIFNYQEVERNVPSHFRASVVMTVAADVNGQLNHLAYPFQTDPIHRTEHGLSLN